MSGRLCEHCGAVLVPRRYSAIRSETPTRFAHRRYCNTECSDAAGADRCKLAGCPRRRYCQGLCSAHYKRMQVGRELGGPIRGDDPQVAIDRFWSKVARGPEQECWPWIKELTNKGYGTFRAHNNGKRHTLAHRYAFEVANGVKLIRSQVVLHSCDNPPCCNPAHLRVGTQKDNMADAKAKGRLSPPPVIRGSASRSAVLHEDEIPEIRMWIMLGYSMASIGSAYGVTYNVIAGIRDGRSWTHVPVGQVAA